MIDQMPDEVWLDRPRWHGWGEYTTKRVENPRAHRVRYIRADLYDSKACPHVVGEVTQHCALAEGEVRRLTQRAEQAEAERDRLRVALERLMRGEGGVNSLEQERIAQEALDHD